MIVLRLSKLGVILPERLAASCVRACVLACLMISSPRQVQVLQCIQVWDVKDWNARSYFLTASYVGT